MKPSVPQRPHDEFHVSQIAVILRKRWVIVAAAVAVGAALTIGLQVLSTRKYESSAQLLVMRKDPRLAAKGVDTTGESEVRVTEELLATHMQMLQSRSIVESALNAGGFAELPSIAANVNALRKPSDYVIDNLTVSRGGKGQARTAHVLNVSLRSTSPEDAQTVLKAIVQQYQTFLSAKFQDVNQEAASLISQAQTVLASELEEAEKNYEQFRQQSSNLLWKTGGTESTNTHRVRYDEILQEITNLQLSRADSESKLDSVEAFLNGRDASQLTDLERLSLVDEKNLTRVGLLLMVQKGETESPNFQAEQPIRLAHAQAEFENYAELQLKAETLLTELGPRHPDVINIRKQMSSLADFLSNQKQQMKSGNSIVSLDSGALFSAYRQLLKNDIIAMERREARLKSLAEDTIQLASEMVTDEIQVDSLRREVQRKQVLFDAAVDRLRDINLAKDYGGFINEVLAEPELGKKVTPKLTISLAVGIFLTMLICAAGIGIAEYRDRRFRTIEDLQATLRVSVLGRIPSVVQTANKSSSLFKRRNAQTPRAPQLLDPETRGADAFRLLRTSLIFSEGEDFRQILCITSPNPADGKSTVVGNLAVSLGQLGRSVLVIDCDLRRPTQHELFTLSNDRGLTNLLNEDLDPSDLIQSTPYKNVQLLPRGTEVPDPAEFLATGRFARLLDSLREKYDHILLDCPPVLPVTDAMACAAISDGVLFVIRVERTSQLHAQAACATLRHAGADVLGVIVNGMAPGSLDDATYGYEYSDDDYPRYSKSFTREGSPAEFRSASATSLLGPRVSSALRRNGKHDNGKPT